MKICSKCSTLKPLSGYYKRKGSKDGYRSMCKECMDASASRYKKENTDKIKIIQKEYAEKNRDNLSKYRSEYNRKNKRRIKEVKKKYYEKNRDAIAEYHKEYYFNDRNKFIQKALEYSQTDKGRISKRTTHQKRKLQKKYTNDGTITTTSLMWLLNKQKHKCKYCGCSLDITKKYSVHLDHVIPLSKGGKHTINNVVWSCSKCNISKSNKIEVQYQVCVDK